MSAEDGHRKLNDQAVVAVGSCQQLTAYTVGLSDGSGSAVRKKSSSAAVCRLSAKYSHDRTTSAVSATENTANVTRESGQLVDMADRQPDNTGNSQSNRVLTRVKPMPDAGILATILLVIGLFLLGLEFFIPSFGMIGTLAGVSLVISLWSANKAWGNGVNPTFFWSYVALLVAGIPGTICGSFYAIQHTPLGKAVVLQPPQVSAAVNPLEELIGRRGTAQTLLTPGGMVIIDRQRLHGESVGMLVDPGTPVVVVGISGNRVVVRPLTADELVAAGTVAAAEPDQPGRAAAASDLPAAAEEPSIPDPFADQSGRA